jgi:hypothetical protein
MRVVDALTSWFEGNVVVTLFALLFFIALSGSSCFALGRTFGRGERYEKGYREGFRDGETGSLARAARLAKVNDDPRTSMPINPPHVSIAPVVESMLVPSTVPLQMSIAGRAAVRVGVGPAITGIPGRHHRTV